MSPPRRHSPRSVGAFFNPNGRRGGMPYIYGGDRWTDPQLRGAACEAVRDARGKCIRGRNGNMLVRISDGNSSECCREVVVLARQLRKISTDPNGMGTGNAPMSQNAKISAPRHETEAKTPWLDRKTGATK